MSFAPRLLALPLQVLYHYQYWVVYRGTALVLRRVLKPALDFPHTRPGGSKAGRDRRLRSWGASGASERPGCSGAPACVPREQAGGTCPSVLTVTPCTTCLLPPLLSPSRILLSGYLDEALQLCLAAKVCACGVPLIQCSRLTSDW